MITHQPRAADQRSARREGSQLRRLAGADGGRRIGTKIQVEKAMSLDHWNRVELALQLVRPLQRSRTPWVRCFEHKECFFAVRKRALELASGLRHRVAGYDQPVDRRVGWYL